MTGAPVPLAREVVLVGGGHAHALVLRRWGMRPLPGARLTLIDPLPATAYTGMLPGHVAGHYPRAALDIDLVRLARFAGARIVLGRATGIDLDRREIAVEGRGPVAYDLASLDVGITSDMPDLPGFADHGVAAKPLGPFATRWADFVRTGGGPVAVIGGGVGGCELALAMAHRLGGGAGVTVVDRGGALTDVAPGTRTTVLGRMAAAGIALIEGAEVAGVAPDGLTLSDGRRIAAAFVTGAAGARPWPWLAETGLRTKDGFVAVDETLRTSDPAVYAAGDCAHLSHAPRPKAGVYAVRAAPVLAANLRADLTGRQRRAFRPQRHYLKLVSLGGRDAVADKWGRSATHPLLWRWKDRIDRRFMDRLTRLTPMAAPALPRERAEGTEAAAGDKPLCGGCGAKVGGATLSAVLAALPRHPRADVRAEPGDDAAILTVGGARQVVTTDHLRAVTDDPWLMARIAAHHAMGDVLAMGARPQAALAQIVLPRMSETLQARWLREIMAAASAVFAEAGATVAGGHTTLGAELTVGFTVTGLVERDPIGLAGARPGDALVLTAPIGSGVLLAAEMALDAGGRDIAALWRSMTAGQSAAAARLAPVARAMTDVTGFGLAGHLSGMLRASGVAGEIALDRVPVFAGAVEAAARGHRSSLWSANRAGAGPVEGAEGARGDLLFDPQTAGGLLAAVPGDAADDLVAGLRDDGYAAARIGDVIEGVPAIRVI